MDKSFENSKPSDIVGVAKLGEFAAFYRNNAEEMRKATNSFLLDYCKQNDFDSKEFKAYKMGLLSSFVFFNQCDAEFRALQTVQNKSE
jgi:hypothetical protein